MKFLIRLLFMLIPIIGMGQNKNTLSKMLWDRVGVCFSNFEDMDEDGSPDFDKIDDSKNGYLKISGSFPTCGCTCASAVAAYKNAAGSYTALRSL